MIVLDEHLDEGLVLRPLSRRLKSQVVSVRELRPGTVIKDEAIPTLLRQYRNATFVTANVSDFWRKLPAHARYSLVCVPVPTERQGENPDLLVAFHRHLAFRTVGQRMGKVIRLNKDEILYYVVNQRTVSRVAWRLVLRG